jgi:hypothetical protein
VALAIMTYWVPDVRNLAQVGRASEAFKYFKISLKHIQNFNSI